MIVGAAFEAPWNVYAAGGAGGYATRMSNVMFNTAPAMFINMTAPVSSASRLQPRLSPQDAVFVDPAAHSSAPARDLHDDVTGDSAGRPQASPALPLLAVTNRGLGNEGLFFEAGKLYEGYVWAKSYAATAQSALASVAQSSGEPGNVSNITYIYIGLHDFTQSPPAVLASIVLQLPALVAPDASYHSPGLHTGAPRPEASGWTKLDFTLTPSAGTSCAGIEPGSDPSIDCGQLPSPAHICVRCGGEFVVGVVIPGGQPDSDGLIAPEGSEGQTSLDRLAQAGLAAAAGDSTSNLSASESRAVYFGLTMLQPGKWGRLPGVPALATAAATLQAMGVRSIRQGGTYSQTIAWKDWRGPLEQRPSMVATWGDSLMGGCVALS